MSNPFDDKDAPFLVLINAVGQHSLWPAGQDALDAPAGWTGVHGPADRDSCLAYVTENWPDIRPDCPNRADTETVSVHRRFVEQAASTPDAIAAVDGDERLTYRELDERSNRLAHRLLELGVRAEDPVAVLMDRSAGLLVATVAVLKAGAYYLPLHTAHPLDRMQWIMDRAKRPVLLADEAWRRCGLPEGREVVVVDTDEHWPQAPATDPAIPVLPGQLAYMMYTSGSTGEPKGVGITHRDVLGLALDGCWDPANHERLLMLSPYAFDPSTYELWVPLLHGGRIVVGPAGDLELATLRRLIEDEKITGLNLAAGLFRLVAEEAPDVFANVREVVTGGDVVSPTAVERVLATNPDAVVRILYGPTEATLAATQAPITAPYTAGVSVPIGRPLDHMQIHILDEHLAPVGEGTVGELYIGGLGVARGYVGRSDLTAERFVADPFTGTGQRMYRTGDLGRWNADGDVEFAGRIDDQVKIRDFRVELAEVEAALAKQAGLAQVVVVARRVDVGDTRLAAFVVPEFGGSGEVDLAAMRAGVGESLPAFMVPTEYTVLDALPLTPNHKVDRAALLAMEPRSADTDTYADGAAEDTAGASADAEQETLCRLFAEVLNKPKVGPEDNFFDLGGQSILAMRLLSRMEAELGVRLEIQDLFNAPTVAELLRRKEQHAA